MKTSPDNGQITKIGMVTMRKYLLALACVFCSTANAGVVTFEYTAVVSSGYSDGPGGFTFDAAHFDGITTVAGNTVRGLLTYDTATPFWVVRWDTHFYKGGVGGMSVNVLENGFTFQSTTTDVPQLQVGNNSGVYGGSTDWFGFHSHTKAFDNRPVYEVSFALFDHSDTAFDSATLPTKLDLSQFEQKNLIMYFERDGTTAQFTADLLTLEQIGVVPEPSTPAILLTGVAMLAGVRRLSRRITEKRGSRAMP